MALPYYNKVEALSASDFFPEHFLAFFFIRNQQNAKEAIARIFKHLVQEQVYSRKQKKWIIKKDQGWTDEQAVAELFNQVGDWSMPLPDQQPHSPVTSDGKSGLP